MYKNLSLLVSKAVYSRNQQSDFKRSMQFFKFYMIKRGISTTSNKSVRFKQITSENVDDNDKETFRPTGVNVKDRDKEICKPTKVSAKDLLDNAATFIDQVPINEDSKWSTSPYPDGAVPRSQAHRSLRPKINPRETSIILFPGEGSQYVGMGKDLLKFPTCRDLFEVANEILKFNLLQLCLQGPKSELDKTANAQVSVLVCSLAAIERLKEEQPSGIENCIATAGFSIGELTALVFAGAISFERAVRLAQIRGEAMQMASEMTPGGMMTIMFSADTKLGYALLKAKESAKAAGVENPQCSVASYLFPHCKVIAGHKECLDFVEKNAKEFNITQVRRLPVAGAFHTELMRPGVGPLRKAVEKSNFKEPLIGVHSNLNGKIYTDVVHIKNQFPKLICRPVRWEQILHAMYERPDGSYFPYTFECGPGDSLKKILKMVNAKAWSSCFSGAT